MAVPEQAISLYQAGRRQEAERVCLETVRQESSNPDLFHMLGALRSETGDWVGALGYFERAAALDDGNPYIQNNLGLALNAVGRQQEAIERFRRAIALAPAFVEAHCDLGVALDQAGFDGEALEAYDRAIAMQPTFARAHVNRGSLLHRLRRLGEALVSYDQALSIQPRYASVQAKRGALLLELGRPGDALACLGRALIEDPNEWLAYVNRSAVYQSLTRFTDALADCERAVQISPQNAVVHNARGDALTSLGRHREALESFARAMKCDPHYAEAHWNASLNLLRLGHYAEGWSLHEWRKKLPRPLARQPRLGQEWTGSEPLEGRTLLLTAEQGFGDTIQFCRYATLAARAGAHVFLQVPAPLKSLLSSLDGVTAAVSTGDSLPRVDLSCLLMSAPRSFGTTLKTIPSTPRYLRSDPTRCAHWRERLGPRRAMRVGLVWSGGYRPEQPELEAINRRRNLPLTDLASLRHPNIEFFSLQKGDAAEAELAQAVASRWDGPELRAVAPLLLDFADTAALMDQLDLVISVDTSTAHLAGALGKPIWILVRFDGCWRWLVDRTDSPWYPTATIYRQERPGDWNGVVKKVRADLFRMAEP